MTSEKPPTRQQVLEESLEFARGGDFDKARSHLKEFGIQNPATEARIGLIEAQMIAHTEPVIGDRRGAIADLLAKIGDGRLSPHRPNQLEQAISDFAREYSLGMIEACYIIRRRVEVTNGGGLSPDSAEGLTRWLKGRMSR